MQTHNLKTVFSHLDKDSKSDIHMLKLIDGEIAVFAAELKAGKKLPAHYHHEGPEIYQILGGDGIFESGQLESDQVVWVERLNIKTGDLFEVQPGMVHRVSGGREDLQMIFVTPPSHLSEDRTFIE